MKVVKMYNGTPNTLTAYSIPFDGTSKEVLSGESIVIGDYNGTYDRFYMAMVKAGFRMSIEEPIVVEEKEDSTTAGTISSEDKEVDTEKAPPKRSPRSKAKGGEKND